MKNPSLIRKHDVDLAVESIRHPDNERWLHEPQTAADLARALDWAKANTPRDADVDAVIEKLGNGQG